MPWRYMVLRGQRVLARCDEAGNLQQRDGRVEIRYRPDDGRAYFAAARNLEPSDEPVLPDAHCGEAEAAPARGRKPKRATSGGGEAKTPPTAPRGAEVLVYVDGACSGNPGPAGSGVVMMWDDTRQELAESLGTATNNIAELTAILRAAQAVPDKSRPVRIYTDSNYSIGVLVRGWKAKANPKLIAEVKRALAELEDVELIHVPGHAGVVLNERADELARRAVETGEPGRWERV